MFTNHFLRLKALVAAVAAVMFLTGTAIAAPSDSSQRPLPMPRKQSTLAADLNAILAAPNLQGGLDGVMVADARSGQILYSANPDKLLIPASNRKLFTAAAALEHLQANHRLITTVSCAGQIGSDGTLSGDIYLRGGGDPLLSVHDLNQMAAQVAATGVKRVTGSIIGDGSLFEGDKWGDGWQQDSLLDYYSPEISALEVNEGIATIALHGGAKAGDPTTFTADPVTSYFTVENHAVTSKSGSAVVIDLTRSLTGTHIVVTGSIPAGLSPDPSNDNTDGRITIPNPALYAATIFAEALEARGVRVSGAPRTGTAPASAGVLATHESDTVGRLLAEMLKPSDNLIAECLTRLEAAAPGQPGSYEAGRAVEDKYFVGIGIDASSHLFADGCGQSRVDFVTPRAEMTLLLAVAQRPDFSTFYDAMSIVGVDGTGKNRMSGTRAAGGNAHVKTGTVRNCRSFSGYVTDRSGRLLAFVILMNNHLLPARALGAVQDKIVERLADEGTSSP